MKTVVFLYLPTFPSSEKVPVLTKEGNQEGAPVFFLPFVSGRISEEGMRVG